VRFILTIIVLMFTFDVLWWQRADRLARRMRRRRAWRTTVALIHGHYAREPDLDVRWPRTAGKSGRSAARAGSCRLVFLWHFIVLPVTVVSAGIVALVLWIRSKVNRTTATDDSVASEGLSRREFLGAVAAAASPPLVTVVATGASLRQLDDFRIQRIDLPLTALPAELDGKTIAHVTDTHVGRFHFGTRVEARDRNRRTTCVAT
jgi:hypothetical protein